MHRRLLPWWDAAGAAIAGSFLVDQLWFHLARHFRSNRWVRAVAGRTAFARAIALLDRHPVWFILLFRFAYGLRAVAPVAIGASRVPVRLFMPLNLVAAIAWGMLFTTAGYCAGPLFERLVRRFGIELAIGVLVLSIGAIALALRRGRKCVPASPAG